MLNGIFGHCYRMPKNKSNAQQCQLTVMLPVCEDIPRAAVEIDENQIVYV